MKTDAQKKLLHEYKQEKTVTQRMSAKNKAAYKARIAIEEILERKAFEAEFGLL